MTNYEIIGDLTMVPDSNKSKEYFNAANVGSVSSSTTVAGGVADITDPAAFNNAINSAGLVVVDYWAPWCRNCKKISPVINRLATELSSTTFVKVNTEELGQLGQENGVDALPTLQFFKGGKKVGEFKGSDSAAIEAAVRSYL